MKKITCNNITDYDLNPSSLTTLKWLFYFCIVFLSLLTQIQFYIVAFTVLVPFRIYPFSVNIISLTFFHIATLSSYFKGCYTVFHCVDTLSFVESTFLSSYIISVNNEHFCIAVLLNSENWRVKVKELFYQSFCVALLFSKSYTNLHYP